MSIIDISVSLREGMPMWPGSTGLSLERIKSIDDGADSNDSKLSLDVHLGTHVDAPLHFVKDGEDVESLPLEVLCGRVFVADLTGVASIGAGELSGLGVPPGTERIIFKTTNSTLWKRASFERGFVALTEEAARWVVDSGIRLVGTDYLSIGPYPDGTAVHLELLGANVVVVEGLNLDGVAPGEYELTCLPLKIIGSEGSPARAILREVRGER